MIIDCICGLKKFKVDDSEIPSEGRKVKCGACSQVWFYDPSNPTKSEPIVEEQSQFNDNNSPQPTINQDEQIPDSVEETISSAEGDEMQGFVQESDEDADLETVDNQSKSSNPGMKIFTDDDDMPSKADMDKSMDEFKASRSKKKGFLASLFAKKDPMEKAKEKTKIADKKKKKKKAESSGSTLRMLIYLFIILLFVLSVMVVPYKQSIVSAFPGLAWYFEAVTPYYNTFSEILKKF